MNEVSNMTSISTVKPWYKKIQNIYLFLLYWVTLGTFQKTLYLVLKSMCCALYGKVSFSSVNDFRFFIVQIKYDIDELHPSHSVDIGILLPWRSTLVEHIKRVNYQIEIWKRSYILCPDIPEKTESHRWLFSSPLDRCKKSTIALSK